MGYSYNFNPSYPYQRPQPMGIPIASPLARPIAPVFPLYGRPVAPASVGGFSAPRLNMPISRPFSPSGVFSPQPGLPIPSQIFNPAMLQGNSQAGFVTNAASIAQKPQIQNHYYTVTSGKEPSSKKKNIKKFLLTTGAVMTGMVATVALGFLGLRIAYPQKFKAFKLIDEDIVRCVNSGIEVWNKTNSKNPINKGMKSFEAFMKAYKNRPKKVDQPVGYIGRLWNAFLNKQEPVVQQMASEVGASAETGLKLPPVLADPWVKINTAIDDMVDASKLFKQFASGMQTDFESVGPGLKQALEKTNVLLDSVQPGVQNFNNTFENAAKSAKQLDSLLTEAKPQVEETVANFKSASKAAIDVMSQTQGVMEKAEGAITEAAGHMGETAKQAQASLKEVKKGVTKTTGQLGHIAAHTHSALTKVEKGVTEATGHMDEAAKKALPAMVEAANHVRDLSARANTVTNPFRWFGRGSKKVDSPSAEVFHDALESLPEST